MTAALLLRRCRLAGVPAGRHGLVDVLLDRGRVASVTPTTTTGAVPDRVVDLDGRWLLPGLWDEHVHLGQWAQVRRRLDVSGATSAAEAAAAVAQRAAAERGTAAAAGVLVGFGFRDGLWPDAPSPSLLDRAAARPVVLVSGDLHCAWLSTAAAQQVAAPLGVVPDERGLVREEAAFAVQRALGRVGEAELDAAVADALAETATRGVVGVVDLEMTDSPGGTVAVWARRAGSSGTGRAASAGLRVEAGTYPQHLEEVLARGVRGAGALSDSAPGSAPLVVAGPLKVITDGSLNTRTACCLEPYPGRSGPGSYGELTWEPDALLDLLRRGRTGGLTPAVHAIGDAAVRSALDALEVVGGGGRVEHAQLVADDDVARFAALGVVASVQPAHLLDDRDVAEVHWRGRTGRAFPLRALLDSGARLAMGSDAPVAALDPWLAVAAAVDRTDPRALADGGRGGPRPPWHPEQSITTAEALAASARGRSAVAVGDVADVVALEADPLADGVAADVVRGAVRVALTVVDGRVVHDATR
ncbi:amidohydrolase family protein [Quadrisphaera oryzae]|uniref:amidohydrolase n=1 Tax=Quadrisphaera TaxID=317661 RepID=UPI001C97183B